MTPTQRPRISLYVRLSRASDESNLSLAGMERDLRALAARLGADVVEPVHIDDGISGGIRNRPAFRRWLSDAHEKRADILAAWSIDRMTREGVSGGGADILDAIETTGVRLVDTQGTDSTTPGFRLGFVVKAEVAREELRSMRLRAQARQSRARDAGVWTTGAAPYGYRIVRRDGRPVLDVEPDEAARVLEAAQRVAAGESPARIVREWNRAGVQPRLKGSTWRHMSLIHVLTGPSVRGYARHGGDLLRDPATGLPRRLWPAILDDELAEQVRVRLTPDPGRARRPGARSDARLLSGLLRCAGCGRTLRASSSRGVDRYRCTAAEQDCAARVSVNAEHVETWAETVLLDDFTRSLDYTETVPLSSADGAERAQLDDAIRAALADLATAATPDAFTRLQALQARRAELDDRPTARKWITRETGRTVGEEWERRDTPGRRDLLAQAIGLSHVKVDRARSGGPIPVAERLTPVWQGEDDRPALRVVD